MTVSPSSLLKPFTALASATFAIALVYASFGATVARAQYSNSDDGGYASGPSGYNDDDDEDGYEDGQDAPDVAYFHDELEDEGTWEDDPEYGQVWSPRNVDADWRPYTRGTWANTEEHGWYWVSDEPFGWATYHYGRWHHSDRRGWVWVPGTRWGPAWVAWRSNDDNIGWAPLPPESRWDHGSGLTISASIYEGPRYASYWSFVEPRYITSPRIYTYCAPPARVVTIITITRPQNNYVFVNRRIVNRGVSVTSIERVTRTRITTVRVNNSDNRSYRTVNRSSTVINVYRPRLTRAAVNPRADRPAVNRAQFRDVDRRPPRKERAAGPNGNNNPANTPFSANPGRAGLSNGAAQNPLLKGPAVRSVAPGGNGNRNRNADVNPGPRGQFRQDGNRNDNPLNRIRRANRNVDGNGNGGGGGGGLFSNQQQRINQGGQPRGGNQANNQQGKRELTPEQRRRQQQNRNKNKNGGE